MDGGLITVTGQETVWHVLHVKPRTEKKVAEFCELRRVLPYLPLREETKIYQRRKVTVQKPAFPGYVFARSNPTAGWTF